MALAINLGVMFKVTFAILLIFFKLGFTLDLNDSCTSPDGKAGRCIFFRDCKHLVDMFNKTVVTPQETLFIKSCLCGKAQGRSLVCCAPKLPKPNECGLDTSNRIVGGQPTELDEFPWTALLHYRKPTGSFGYHCGGSLITSRYVVTAAHCINAIPRGWQVIGVRLGEHNLSTPLDCDGPNSCADAPIDMDIEKITVHEEYNAETKSQWNDIALIRFTRDVNFSNFIKPICLPVSDPERSRNVFGSKMTAAGWGRTEADVPSEVKLKVQLDIMDSIKCRSVYRNSGIQLRDTQTCAGGMRGKDSCSGDSGGPLMLRIKTNYFLYGIVSFGPNKCGTKDVPGVYTNVAKYVDWIESNVK